MECPVSKEPRLRLDYTTAPAASPRRRAHPLPRQQRRHRAALDRRGPALTIPWNPSFGDPLNGFLTTGLRSDATHNPWAQDVLETFDGLRSATCLRLHMWVCIRIMGPNMGIGFALRLPLNQPEKGSLQKQTGFAGLGRIWGWGAPTYMPVASCQNHSKHGRPMAP